MLRRIPLGAMMNLRDLGGYPTADGRETKWGRLFRGDQPTELTERDFQWLLERNVTTVIDLRSSVELERAPDPLASTSGFTYHHSPLVGGENLPDSEESLPKGYFEMLDSKVYIAQVLRLIAEASNGVLFHCTAGKDRTGCTAALLLGLCGVGLADILADYQVSETYIMSLIRRVRSETPNLPAYMGRSKSAYMEECLRLLLEKYGDLMGYLRAAGLTDKDLGLLRGKLLEE